MPANRQQQQQPTKSHLTTNVPRINQQLMTKVITDNHQPATNDHPATASQTTSTN